MFSQISHEIKKLVSQFPDEDSLLFNNQVIKINKNNFFSITAPIGTKTVAFIDGGEAQIISAGNFCLSFIRVGGLVFRNNQKIKNIKQEFYLFTKAKRVDDDLFYESKIFGDMLIDEKKLLISSNDHSIRSGLERAPVSKISSVARRFAELSMAAQIEADLVVLDGTLSPVFRNEDKYLDKLGDKVCALAKSSSLFTISGNSPVILLNKIGPDGCWHYFVDEKTSFVKLHEKTKHVFRFEGNREILPFLVDNSQDALFLGYPYGLILADQLARVSNSEQDSLKMRFLLSNEWIAEYLHSSDAHDILDSLG